LVNILAYLKIVDEGILFMTVQEEDVFYEGFEFICIYSWFVGL